MRNDFDGKDVNYLLYIDIEGIFINVEEAVVKGTGHTIKEHLSSNIDPFDILYSAKKYCYATASPVNNYKTVLDLINQIFGRNNWRPIASLRTKHYKMAAAEINLWLINYLGKDATDSLIFSKHSLLLDRFDSRIILVTTDLQLKEHWDTNVGAKSVLYLGSATHLVDEIKSIILDYDFELLKPKISKHKI